MKKPTVLVAERNAALQRHILDLLQDEFAVLVTPTLSDLLRMLRRKTDLAVLVVSVSWETLADGLTVVRVLRRWEKKPAVIFLAADSSEELVLAALRAGVADYFKLPLSDQEFVDSVKRCVAKGQDWATASTPHELVTGRDSVGKGNDPTELIGHSSTMERTKTYLRKVAATDSNALITGETGTGKELVASYIHNHSQRCRKSFVRINCAAIPDSLLESELFGYERGAFTGADRLKEGALKLADGGTVFFDEIGDMSPYAQAKILRALESKEVWRLGGKGSIPIDIRVVAATNRDLEHLMQEEKFRADLYFRLNVARISLSPLRERKEDLRALCSHYIRQMNDRFELTVEGFTDNAFALLLQYSWPGNVRELKNFIEAIFINQPTRWITVDDFPEQFRRRVKETEGISQTERDRLLAALFATNWNKYQAAQKLQWSRMTLYRKMAKYQIVTNEKNKNGESVEDRSSSGD
ncbi:MAG: sigma 54-interacting transcriptional regulator [Candidatus Binatia bacterium]